MRYCAAAGTPSAFAAGGLWDGCFVSTGLRLAGGLTAASSAGDGAAGRVTCQLDGHLHDEDVRVRDLLYGASVQRAARATTTATALTSRGPSTIAIHTGRIYEDIPLSRTPRERTGWSSISSFSQPRYSGLCRTLTLTLSLRMHKSECRMDCLAG